MVDSYLTDNTKYLLLVNTSSAGSLDQVRNSSKMPLVCLESSDRVKFMVEIKVTSKVHL